MLRNWFGGSIARKLLLAFFSIFLITYLITALVVQNAVQTAMTDSELDSLSKQARLKLSNFTALFDESSIDLRAWAKLDVMSEIVSGDVNKRVENTLANMKKDYALNGELYVFNAAGLLIASSDRLQQTATIPDAWKPRGPISFVNKHINPLDNDEVVALVTPIEAASTSDQIGTLVMSYHWGAISAAMPNHALLLYHRDLTTKREATPESSAPNNSQPGWDHREILAVMGPSLGISMTNEALSDLVHNKGWLTIGNNKYLVSGAEEKTGLLSGWEVVMFGDPESLHQSVNILILKLVILCLILSLPLIFIIRWLADRLTAPLRELTQFVSELSETRNLSKRLELHSNDEISVLATVFNKMTTRLESASKYQKQLVAELQGSAEVLENKVRDRTSQLTALNSELGLALENLKAAQSQLVHQEKMASLGQLVAGVAHEINNPIGYIYANLPHLEEYVLTLLNLLDAVRNLPLPADSRQQLGGLFAKADIEFLREDLLSIIRDGKLGSARITEIVSSLRSFSRLGEAEVKKVSLEDGINETLALLHYQFKERIKVVQNYHLNTPVLCRPGQLNQVFMNIISNAIQAIEGTGTITISTRREGTWAIVEISDTGCGIPAEVMSHIFDPFFTTKPVGTGTGLGLSISHSLIEEHGGRIGVNSEVGRGTTFTLYIPCDGSQLSI